LLRETETERAQLTCISGAVVEVEVEAECPLGGALNMVLMLHGVGRGRGGSLDDARCRLGGLLALLLVFLMLLLTRLLPLGYLLGVGHDPAVVGLGNLEVDLVRRLLAFALGVEWVGAAWLVLQESMDEVERKQVEGTRCEGKRRGV